MDATAHHQQQQDDEVDHHNLQQLLLPQIHDDGGGESLESLKDSESREMLLAAPAGGGGASPAPSSALTGAKGEEAESDAPNPQKIVKRGRGGRRAGAGRKRKSDAGKAEAKAAAAGGLLSSSPRPASARLRRMSSTTKTTTTTAATAAATTNGPAPKKKKKKLSPTPPLDEATESHSTVIASSSSRKMPRQLRFGKTILYVKEVEPTVDFYERAFGMRRRFVHHTKQYAELETGLTALSFASNELARNNLAHVEFRPNDPTSHPPGMEIAFSSADVHRDYKRAIEAGAKAVSAPKTLPWGQVVAYVRDLNGVLVEIATELRTPLKK